MTSKRWTALFGLLVLGTVLLTAVRWFSSSRFPNDTQTRVLSKGKDCGPVLDVQSAYYTRFGDKTFFPALVFDVIIRNDSFEKVVMLRNAQNISAPYIRAENTSEQLWAPLSISYLSNTGGFDRARVLMQRNKQSDGTENEKAVAEVDGTYTLAVHMKKTTYTCSNIHVGKGP